MGTASIRIAARPRPSLATCALIRPNSAFSLAERTVVRAPAVPPASCPQTSAGVSAETPGAIAWNVSAGNAGVPAGMRSAIDVLLAA